MISAPEGPVRDLALRMTKFQKLDDDVKAMFMCLAEGRLVDATDLRDGLILAMRCTVTTGGQSLARRKNAEQVMTLRDAMFGPTFMAGAYIPATPIKPKKNAIPDLNDRPAVEAWLDS